VEGTVTLRDSGGQPGTTVVALLRRTENALALQAELYISGSFPNVQSSSIDTRPPVYGGSQFTFQGVAPGEYLLFAWPSGTQVEYAEPEFERQYAALGKAVTVTEGTKVTVNIDRALVLPER
jgi:hypothetical protein